MSVGGGRKVPKPESGDVPRSGRDRDYIWSPQIDDDEAT